MEGGAWTRLRQRPPETLLLTTAQLTLDHAYALIGSALLFAYAATNLRAATLDERDPDDP